MNDQSILAEKADAYDLLDCRMAMLGLDRDAIENGGSTWFNDMRRRCRTCDFRQPCAIDLSRDPNDPVWETYCPNTGTLLAIAHDLWQSNYAAGK